MDKGGGEEGREVVDEGVGVDEGGGEEGTRGKWMRGKGRKGERL